ncbi:transcriptional coactivator/pterin dehydratase [Lepidopterella palustris CBS 459.81]|uniref:4a-hydroxytetrahydrobiopterin dehydratase n=1 Tax=Lepidopterella palustris CBS 459.81 TaxID=1314670 RepID=A0A8E2EKQ6_9PEZI|nr:transcriptional coactivator/pterin dehydratase [Lepidopterella palustris CBS 459.81]
MALRYMRLSQAIHKYESIYRSGIPSIVHQALQIPTRHPIPASHSPIRTNFRRTSCTSDSNPTPSSTPNSTPIFSANSPDELPSRASDLLRNSPWTLTTSRIGIARTYRFKTFKTAWNFMNLVAAECQKQRHHPSWHNLYNEVTIEWTTHRPRGLSVKDVAMAEFCDRTATDIGVETDAPALPEGSSDNVETKSKGASGNGNGGSTAARGDYIVQQRRAMHIPAESVAIKLYRRFQHRR